MSDHLKRILELISRVSEEPGHQDHVLTCLVCRRLFLNDLPYLIDRCQDMEQALALFVEGKKTRNDLLTKKGEIQILDLFEKSKK